MILSQLFRGFTKEIKTVEAIDTMHCWPTPWCAATETAYKAVMKPKEGTILTVAKGMADKAVELVSPDRGHSWRFCRGSDPSTETTC